MQEMSLADLGQEYWLDVCLASAKPTLKPYYFLRWAEAKKGQRRSKSLFGFSRWRDKSTCYHVKSSLAVHHKKRSSSSLYTIIEMCSGITLSARDGRSSEQPDFWNEMLFFSLNTLCIV